MPRYKINYTRRIRIEQTIEATDLESARKAQLIGVYDGIPTSMVPAAVQEIDEDTRPVITETNDPPTPLPPDHNRTLTIEVEGGCVQGIYGLPDGWEYIVHDHDILDECHAEIASLVVETLVAPLDVKVGMKLWYRNPPEDQPEQWATPRLVQLKSVICQGGSAQVFTTDGDVFSVPPAELCELPSVGSQVVFFPTGSEHQDRRGQEAEITQVVAEADDTHDWEALPMFRLRFPDGHEIEAFADEISSDTISAD
jgi:hypothetical protein